MKYLDNQYINEFNAVILEVRNLKNNNGIILNETYFYPEGGGQPGDRGSINGYVIIDTLTEDGKTIHITADSVDSNHIGQTVECKIDGKRRLALMQQHTGQHLLSSCAEKLFDAATVGFHIGDDYVTIDLDKKLTTDDISTLEIMANDTIWSNIEVLAHYPTEDELGRLPLRKQPKVTKDIRVIEIKDFDFSPCGGTHTKTTAEIGIIKIKKTENYKTGVRIEFVCGLYALDVFKKQNQIISELMQIYSVQDHEVIDFAKNNLDQVKTLKKEILLLEEELLDQSVNAILSNFEDFEGIKVVKLSEEYTGMNNLRKKCSKICSNPNFIVIGTSSDANKTHIVLSKSQNIPNDIDMNGLFKSYFAPLGCKGGGNSSSSQGGYDGLLSTDAITDEIESYIEKIIENIN
ncbi:MAG: alanyl-tRNA editing protein [Bacillota bacterium]|nr:alanyl-tRNA editing protein [Bacillota bacterium]